ncbi:MAG: RHS repeat-associated core domain-containing protein [Acidobacteriota bacterium]
MRVGEAKSRLQHLIRARYYDPRMGRFLGEDPLSARLWYIYAGNDPISYTDPLGLVKFSWKVQFHPVGGLEGLYRECRGTPPPQNWPWSGEPTLRGCVEPRISINCSCECKEGSCWTPRISIDAVLDVYYLDDNSKYEEMNHVILLRAALSHIKERGEQVESQCHATVKACQDSCTRYLNWAGSYIFEDVKTHHDRWPHGGGPW